MVQIRSRGNRLPFAIAALQHKSFTRFFQKIADSKGRAFGRSPQRAELFILLKTRKGVRKQPGGLFSRGNPRMGFPLLKQLVMYHFFGVLRLYFSALAAQKEQRYGAGAGMSADHRANFVEDDVFHLPFFPDFIGHVFGVL